MFFSILFLPFLHSFDRNEEIYFINHIFITYLVVLFVFIPPIKIADVFQTATSYNQPQRKHLIFFLRILLSFWAPIVVHRTQLTLLINSFHLPVKDQVYYLTHLFFLSISNVILHIFISFAMSRCHFAPLLIHLGSLNGIKSISPEWIFIEAAVCGI